MRFRKAPFSPSTLQHETGVSKISTLKSVFENFRFRSPKTRTFGVDGRQKRINKYPFSNLSGFVWTRPKLIVNEYNFVELTAEVGCTFGRHSVWRMCCLIACSRALWIVGKTKYAVDRHRGNTFLILGQRSEYKSLLSIRFSKMQFAFHSTGKWFVLVAVTWFCFSTLQANHSINYYYWQKVIFMAFNLSIC